MKSLKDKYPHASVLISSFNGSAYIKNQIDSILSQDHRQLSVYIRDDGSHDNSKALINEYARRYKNIILYDQNHAEQPSITRSYNELLSMPLSEYICFSDQDDEWKRDKISCSLKKLIRLEDKYGSETPILVHTDLCIVNEKQKAICNSFMKYQKLNPAKSKLNYLLSQNNVTGCTMIFNKALRDRALPIPKEALVHDWWFSLVASLFGIIYYIDKPTVYYRQHNTNHIGARKYGLNYFLKRLSNPDKIRQEIADSCTQAEALYKRFKNDINNEQKDTLLAYIGLRNAGILRKRQTIIKHKLFKQDILRTLGFLIFI